MRNNGCYSDARLASYRTVDHMGNVYSIDPSCMEWPEPQILPAC